MIVEPTEAIERELSSSNRQIASDKNGKSNHRKMGYGK